MALFAALLAAPALAQPASPPVRVVAVTESTTLGLYGKRGSATAPPGTRLVMATIAADAAVGQLSTEDLRLLLQGQVYGCQAIGSNKNGYCPATATVVRQEQRFAGTCLTVGSLVTMDVDSAEISAAFVVPQGVDLASAQLMARYLGGRLDLESKEAVKLPFGLTARIVGVTKYAVGWLIDVEVGNTADKALPLGGDDLRLGAVRAGTTVWRVGQGFLYDRTTPPNDGGNGERVNSVSIAPGASRVVRATFLNVAADSAEKWQLGYFGIAAVPFTP